MPCFVGAECLSERVSVSELLRRAKQGCRLVRFVMTNICIGENNDSTTDQNPRHLYAWRYQ